MRSEISTATIRTAALAIGALLAFTTAACGAADGDGVATAGGSGPASSNVPAAPLDEQEQHRRFIQCLRDNGLEVPDQQGGDLKLGDGSGAPADETDAALGACREFLPDGGEAPRPSPDELAKLREHAKCMRDNGVPAFPDPDPDAGGLARAGGDDPLDPNDPRLSAAFETCRQLLPNPDVSFEQPGR